MKALKATVVALLAAIGLGYGVYQVTLLVARRSGSGDGALQSTYDYLLMIGAILIPILVVAGAFIYFPLQLDEPMEGVLILEWVVLVAVALAMAAGCAVIAQLVTVMLVWAWVIGDNTPQTLFERFAGSLVFVIPLAVAIAVFLTIVVKSPLGRR